MKSILFVIASLFLNLIYAQKSKTITSNPDKVTVYLTGAEISYNETLSIPAGSSEIVLEGVSPYLDEQSISAFFKGALVIDTKKGMRYPEAPKVFETDRKYTFILQRISDSLLDLSYAVKDCSNKTAALQKEKYLLLNNRLMKGEFAKDSIPLLKASLDLLRSRLNNIDEEELNLLKRYDKIQALIASLNERKQFFTNLQNQNINGINTIQYNPIYQIFITIEASTAVTGSLNVKYYTSQAGWMPRYDILAGSGRDKIQLVHRAQVYQNTGVDWKDVALTLSTSNPAMGNTKPLLNAWNLYFGYPNTYPERVHKKIGGTYNYNQYKPQIESKDISTNADDAGAFNPPVNEPVFTMGDNFLRTEYEIKTKYSIVSDNKGHNVIVSSNEVPVSLTYMAVPKLDRDAFLMGKIANWEDLNLLPASARLYFDESYIGLTAIEPETTKDTLYLNLGRDRSIVVKRQALKDKCRDQVLTDIKVHTKTFEITIRNTKQIALEFEIEDQIPITNDNNIKITLLDKDGALYNELSGKLTWKLNIKPKDVKKVTFSYEVRFPKDKNVMGL